MLGTTEAWLMSCLSSDPGYHFEDGRISTDPDEITYFHPVCIRGDALTHDACTALALTLV